MSTRHFLDLNDISRSELLDIVQRAIELKARRARGEDPRTLQGRTLAMIFEKASTRTRVSFAAAMTHLGGQALDLDAEKMQLERGEPIEDTARVLSQMVDAIMIRTAAQERIERMAGAAAVPVINGLSNSAHPCQLLADLMTWIEHRGELQDRVAVWLGDGNNVCRSWIDAARILGFPLRIACPEGYAPQAINSGHVQHYDDPWLAVEDADLLLTDVWTSMGQEHEQDERQRIFSRYQVNERLLQRARRDVLFMHCLPAHRGEEVSAEVIDGPHSVVWQEAGNRLHAQKALLEFLLRGGRR